MLPITVGGIWVPVIVRAGIALAVLMAGPALAADEKGGRPSDRALAPLVACRPIADPRARATCYDAALDKLQQSVADRAVVVMDREQVKASFGFGGSQPLPRSVAAKALPEPIQEIDSTVTTVQSLGYDNWAIRLASGAVWRTTDSALAFPPKVGATVKIRRASLGGYTMFLGRNQTVRVLRAK
jgi:hypothetical protein